MSGRAILGEGRFLRLVRQGRWEYVERTNVTGIVAVLAVTDDDELLCVEQERVAVGRRVVDLPAGLAGDDGHELLETAAARELVEETGYAAGRLARLAEAPPSPGLSDEVVTFFRAYGLTRVGAGGGDRHEEIEVHRVALARVPEWLEERRRAGALIDLKLYSGLYLLQPWPLSGSAPSS